MKIGNVVSFFLVCVVVLVLFAGVLISATHYFTGGEIKTLAAYCRDDALAYRIPAQGSYLKELIRADEEWYWIRDGEPHRVGRLELNTDSMVIESACEELPQLEYELARASKDVDKKVIYDRMAVLIQRIDDEIKLPWRTKESALASLEDVRKADQAYQEAMKLVEKDSLDIASRDLKNAWERIGKGEWNRAMLLARLAIYSVNDAIRYASTPTPVSTATP